MKTEVILIQTDNPSSTSSLNFYRSNALPDAQNSVRASKAIV